MAKSNSKTSQQYGSRDEADDQRDDEQPTTSKADNFTPVQISHNMNDLKALDFNSADEIRQAMKAVLAGRLPPQLFSEESNRIEAKAQNIPGPKKSNEPKKTHIQYVRKTVQRQVQQNLYQKIRSTAQAWTLKANRFGTRKKRPGRPPKAGPSKTVKKSKISSMYVGKLSNVVRFKRRWEPESESDVDSVVLFY